MDDVCEDDLCWLQLDSFRMLLIKTIEPSRITPYLRQCQVISAEDEEQLFNDPSLVIRRRKVGVLLDILQRTGVKGYTAFLESLELDYPRLYTKITGREPNKTFSILIDTAGESGLTQFLMSEVSRLQRALQDERKRRQQACTAAQEQEAWTRQQELRDQELRKLTERVQKLREERERLSEEVKQLRDHNYSLMADINALHQDKSNALLANRDLQIQVERLRHTVQQAESQTRLWKHRQHLRPLQERRPFALPSDMFFHPDQPEDPRGEKQQEKKEEMQQEEKHEQEEVKQEEEKQEGEKQEKQVVPPHLNLLPTVFKLRRDLHRAEEQRARAVEEKEVLELRCTELKGDAKIYRQRSKETLRQLEEVIGERDKALASRAEQQEEVRQLLQEKDRYREQVRQLTEESDRLEIFLLRSQGEELQLRTRLRRLTCQWERGVSSEEDPKDSSVDKGSSEDVLSRTSGDNEDAATQQHSSTAGGAESELSLKTSTTASWDKQTDDCLTSGVRPTFFYRRKQALRSKLMSKEFKTSNLDNSSTSDITDSD